MMQAITSRVRLLRCILYAGLLVWPSLGRAETYPIRPLKIVVGFAAGGPTDVIARVVGEKIGSILGQRVLIENRTGASGNIGSQAVASSAPDGYTILMATNNNSVNESLFKNLGFSVIKDFAPVAPLAQSPSILVVHPSLNVKTVGDLVALVKANPSTVLYATGGIGSAGHIAGEMLNMRAGMKMIPVHYKGSGDTVRDLLSGQIKIMFSPAPPILALVQSANLRAVASTGLQRSSAFPDLPTMSESGVAGFDTKLWFGLLVRAGTPPDIIVRLSEATAQALGAEDVKKVLHMQGFDLMTGSRAQFAQFIQSEVNAMRELISHIGMKID